MAPTNFVGASSQALAGLAPGIAANQNVYTPQQAYGNAVSANSAAQQNFLRGLQNVMGAYGAGVNRLGPQFPVVGKGMLQYQNKALGMQERGGQQILGQIGALNDRTQAQLQSLLPAAQAQIDRSYSQNSGAALSDLVSRGLAGSTTADATARGQAYDRNLAMLQAQANVGGLEAQYGTQIGLARQNAAQQFLGANVGQLNNMAQTYGQTNLAGLNFQGQALGQLGQMGVSGLGTLAQLGSQIPFYNPTQYGGMPQQYGGGTTNPGATFQPQSMGGFNSPALAGNYGTSNSMGDASSAFRQAAFGSGTPASSDYANIYNPGGGSNPYAGPSAGSGYNPSDYTVGGVSYAGDFGIS